MSSGRPINATGVFDRDPGCVGSCHRATAGRNTCSLLSSQNKGTIVPERIEDISFDVLEPTGIKILGTPIGFDQFIADKMKERITKEREL